MASRCSSVIEPFATLSHVDNYWFSTEDKRVRGFRPQASGLRRQKKPKAFFVFLKPEALKEPHMSDESTPLVGVIMGSKSDWETMRAAVEVLEQFGVPHQRNIVSAHRTPELMTEYATSAEGRGLEVIIAGAGGAAHLPGMVAAMTLLPVLGVPVESRALSGLDSLLSIVQMPGGVPVATLAIGTAGAKNAGLLAIRILAGSRPELREKLRDFHSQQTEEVRGHELP
jgi:5-(carboxyamino)imidazole ribonucleotide mutase